jgi:twitching motility protein PilT
MEERLERLLVSAFKRGASDLHLVPARFPYLRIDGELVPISDEGLLPAKEIERLIFSILEPEEQKRLDKYKDIDFSLSIGNQMRFRVNVYFQTGGLAAAFRLIASDIRTIEELNLPPVLHELVNRRQGLVLITGPAGMGKSTTLAALVDDINHKRSAHIITIEEPIEYLFSSDKAIISQREISHHSLNWHRALRAALRQDPDVIMIGELRDPESIAIALTAAETGHLVLGSLHTNSASQTIDRIIDVLPEGMKNQARFQLASVLVGVLSQRLVPRLDGGRIPAVEILLATAAVRNLIRENKVYQIDLVIETSFGQGMVTLERSLATLIDAEIISLETALQYTQNQERLRSLLVKK